MHSFQIRNKSLTYWYLDQAPLHQLQKTDYNLNSEKSTVHFPEKVISLICQLINMDTANK